jgi:uncharacterized RDD family membrane protein YckC
MNVEPVILPGKENSEWIYADIGSRSYALFLDVVIIAIVDFVLACIFYHVGSLYLPSYLENNPDSALPLVLIALAVISFIILCWLYFACFESSVWKATPGKKLCEMIVVDEKGLRLSFWDASFRFLLNFSNSAPKRADFLLITVTDLNQDLEDMASETLVLRRKRTKNRPLQN